MSTETIQNNVTIFEDGHLVSRVSDWIVYNVEAENVGAVVRMYGKCMTCLKC